jgi:mannose-6-phosphate isomerase-like protein (cupin superfamily)
MANAQRVNLAEKLAQFDAQWSPRVVETLDDYEIKVVKIEGDFVWHSHADADELFLVLRGRFRMDLRDRAVDVAAGELIVVPRGVEHKPHAAALCEVLLFERRGLVNTGDAPANERTRIAERI